MKLYGLIGYPLSHSWSKAYFSEKFIREGITGSAYELFPLEEIRDLNALLSRNTALHGLNVTIPHKEKVMALLDYVDPLAAAAGTVNVIRIKRINNKVVLSGYNTDIPAFEEVIAPYLRPGMNALILGSGGAAKATRYVFRKYGLNTGIVSRSAGEGRDFTYADLTEELIQKTDIIVNASPAGMYPSIDAFPSIPYVCLNKDCLVFDWIYNPEKTLFLKQAGERGCSTINGLEVFRLQAEKAWEIWNKQE